MREVESPVSWIDESVSLLSELKLVHFSQSDDSVIYPSKRKMHEAAKELEEFVENGEVKIHEPK